MFRHVFFQVGSRPFFGQRNLTRQLQRKITFNHNRKSPKWSQVPKYKCSFHTTSRRPINPLFAVLLKTQGIKVLKGFSILFGRSFRIFYNKLPEKARVQISKHKIILGITGLVFPFFCYYSYTHYETCPITGRKRWVTFTQDQVVTLSQFDFDHLMAQYKEKLLADNSEVYVPINKIVEKLVNGNQDLEMVKKTDWHLNVIDDASVTNAFVLPNGQIFVFTGMLKMLNTWEIMAVILGHEMAHAILGHAQEQQTYLAFGEILAVPLLAFIWFYFEDFLAFLVYSLQQYLYPIIFQYGFNLPYSRLLETEADEVGLQLAAKACFDPRWSVLLWEKMALNELMGESNFDEFEYLSTHPSNQKRAIALEQLLPEAVKCREDCKCPPLSPDVDPVQAAHSMRNCINNVKERKEIVQEMEQVASTNYEDKEQDLKILNNRLKQLESEYILMISPKLPNEEKQEKKPEQNKGVLHGIWDKIFKKVATTGKLTNTIFDRKLESEALNIKSEDLKKVVPQSK